MERLLAEVVAIRRAAHKDVSLLWTKTFTDVAIHEPAFVDNILRTVMPVQLGTTLPSPTALRALVQTSPVRGTLLKDWSKDFEAHDLRRIEQTIRVGMVQGQGIPQIVRNVVGTRAQKGRDGITQVSRNEADMIVRTSTNHFANQARQMWAKENRDIADFERFFATLDSRTTPVCRAADSGGENSDGVYPIGVGPIPPLHQRCRSIRVLQPDPVSLGERPMKPVTERMLLREFAEREGFQAPTSRGRLPHGTRGKFDDFARRRTRELIGRVPAQTTYQQFLQNQSAEFQNDVLGKTRAELFRKGGLTLDKFVDRNGAEFTLSELADMHASAFRAAGFQPSDFRVPSQL